MPVQPAAWHASWLPLGHKRRDLPSVHINSWSGRRTLGLEKLVNFSSCETSNQLFSEFVLPISSYPTGMEVDVRSRAFRSARSGSRRLSWLRTLQLHYPHQR